MGSRLRHAQLAATVVLPPPGAPARTAISPVWKDTMSARSRKGMSIGLPLPSHPWRASASERKLVQRIDEIGDLLHGHVLSITLRIVFGEAEQFGHLFLGGRSIRVLQLEPSATLSVSATTPTR